MDSVGVGGSPVTPEGWLETCWLGFSSPSLGCPFPGKAGDGTSSYLLRSGAWEREDWAPSVPGFPVVQRIRKGLKPTSAACMVSSPWPERGLARVVLLEEGRARGCSLFPAHLVSSCTGWRRGGKDPREAAWPRPAYSPPLPMCLIPWGTAGGYPGSTAFT